MIDYIIQIKKIIVYEPTRFQWNTNYLLRIKNKENVIQVGSLYLNMITNPNAGMIDIR